MFTFRNNILYIHHKNLVQLTIQCMEVVILDYLFFSVAIWILHCTYYTIIHIHTKLLHGLAYFITSKATIYISRVCLSVHHISFFSLSMHIQHTIMVLKPTNIRWFRAGSQPFWKIMYCIVLKIISTKNEI